jgi:hypothetical protein
MATSLPAASVTVNNRRLLIRRVAQGYKVTSTADSVVYNFRTNTMFDLTDEGLQTSLAEAIGWCDAQPITARLTETPELQQRRDLVEQGAELRHLAHVSSDRYWNKLFRCDHTKTPEWRKAEELLHEAFKISLPLLAEELRSTNLKPGSALGEARTEQQREGIVRSVLGKRSELLRSRGDITLHKIGPDICGGRLLVFIPEETLSDGAAEFESNCFFDSDNAPPWDTWVAYSDRTLLSWVPAQLIPLVQRGIDVNPEECIHWMSSSR